MECTDLDFVRVLNILTSLAYVYVIAFTVFVDEKYIVIRSPPPIIFSHYILIQLKMVRLSYLNSLKLVSLSSNKDPTSS